MTTLLSIATGQNLANLIPALHLKPAEVLILATGKMAEQATLLRRLIDRHGIAARIEPFDDASPDTLADEALRIAESLTGRYVVFNATGGTKQMALVLREHLPGLIDDLDILYADTAHQRIDWLRRSKKRGGAGSEPMPDLLTIEDILGAQGFRLGEVKSRRDDWIDTAKNRAPLTEHMGKEAERLEHVFPQINRLAQQALADEKTFQPTQELNRRPTRDLADLLKLAHQAEILVWNGDTRIDFTDEDAARYFGGAWLEEYTFFKLHGSRPRDYAVSAEILAPDKTRNEIDALVVHRNRLLAIECKTLRFGRDGGKDADLMYKLDSLAQRAGGLMHQRLLLSARVLDEVNAARARDFKIEVVAGKDIRHFPKRIREWMNA